MKKKNKHIKIINSLKCPIKPGSAWSEFTIGFNYFKYGYLFIRENPRLLFIAIPSMIFYLPVFFIFLNYFPFLLSKIGSSLIFYANPVWNYGFFGIISIIIIFIIGLLFIFWILIVIVTFLLIASIIASIFNDILAERTEKIKKGNMPKQVHSLFCLPKIYFFIIKVEIIKISFYLFIQLLLFCLNIVPVFGSIAYFFLGGIFTIYFIGFEYIDYSLSRRFLPFKEKYNLLLIYKWRVFGYGSVLSLLLMIPIINIVVMSLAVVGGTLIFLDLKLDELNLEKYMLT